MTKYKEYTFLVFVGIFLTTIFSTTTFAQQIVLQPDGAAGKDAYITSGFPNNNYESTFYMTFEDPTSHGLIEFTLPVLPLGATLTSATLEVLEQNDNCDENINALEIHVNNAAWDETTVTWNNAPAYGPSLGTHTGEPVGDTCEWLIFDVTTPVQNWYGGSSNYGFRITGPSNGDVVKWIRSSDHSFPVGETPILRINYTQDNADCECYEVTYTNANNPGDIKVELTDFCFNLEENTGKFGLWNLSLFFDSMNKQALAYGISAGVPVAYLKFHGDQLHVVTGIYNFYGNQWIIRGYKISSENCPSE